jgi:ferredoxin
MFYIDQEKCVKCGQCIPGCPSGAFVATGPGKVRHSVVYESVTIDPGLCTECGTCTSTEYWCPLEAIHEEGEAPKAEVTAAGNKYEKYFYRYDFASDDYYKRWAPPEPKDGVPAFKLEDLPWKWITRLDDDAMPGSNFYVMHWVIPDESAPQMEGVGHPPHIHKDAELLFVFGGDPHNPKELGAEIEVFLGPELERHVIKESCVLFIPPNFLHCPWKILKTTKPWIFLEVNQGMRHTEKTYNQILPREVVEQDEGLEFFHDDGY